MVVRSGMVEWDRVTSGGRVMEGKLRDRFIIYMSLYCMLDGVRQGRRDI